MDAVKFIEERNRMCKAYSGSDVSSCAKCPARYMECNELNGMTGVAGTDIVNVVEKWAAAHPRKTRQDVFLEQWPEAYIEPTTDALFIKPCHIEKSMDGSQECCISHCADCRREFWGKEVE